MKGPTHGALVAGVSSGVVAAWSRKKAWDRYDPNVEPPSYRERLKNQAPIIAKGIAFTGLTWAVAKHFDKIEATILSDSHLGYTADINTKTHHNLHSLPYIGPFFVAARLVKKNSGDFGAWIGNKLNISNRSEEISKSLDEFADWVLNYPGLGAVGHIVGDLPTSGRGGTALQLLRPIIDTNFSLGLVLSSAEPVNKTLITIGGLLTGASWILTTTYLMSWKPPELKIKDYTNRLKGKETAEEIIRKILKDIDKRLRHLLELGKRSLFDLPIFKSTGKKIRDDPFQNWFKMDIPPKIFGIDSLDTDSLREIGILPRDFDSQIETSSLYQKEHIWPTVDEIPLVVDEKAISQENSSLFNHMNEDQHSSSITNEQEPHHTRSLFDKDTSDSNQNNFTSDI